MSEFKKWTSIEKFSDTVISAAKSGVKQMNMIAKVKLHGTNSCVRVDADGSVFFQKRSQDITTDNDNFGFVAWASNVEWLDKKCDYRIWGEWAGSGINNNDAVTKLDGKKFFVFAVEKDDKMIYNPSVIEEFVPYHNDIFVLPIDFEIQIDFSSQEKLNEIAKNLNEKLDAISVEDHYIKERFDISGVGEGFVISPTGENGNDVDVETYNRFVFKVKTEAHSVQKTKGVKAQVIVPASVYAFTDMFATPQRFEQIYNENFQNLYSMKNTADFIRLVISDIEKESVNEREKSGLEMKEANKMISASIVKWLKSKCDGL